ncbi:alkaline phosphatase D family protein [Propionibacteriaceae bacterium Y2011]
MINNLDRRHFLGLAGAGAGVGAAVGLPALIATAGPFREDVFTLGVASGDPLPDSVVLWTRLALDPVAVDGHGGMPDRKVPVRWELAADESFGRIVRRGVEVATPEWGHSVHVEVFGLQPDREYWYRFQVGDQRSPVGRTRTAPLPGAELNSLTFAYTSCQSYVAGHFTALEYLAADDLDLVVHLGDYIYEGRGADTIENRSHLPAHETQSLADYRIRYGQYKSDPALQAGHAAAPWILVPDDHEVENNYTGGLSQPDSEPDQDPEVFAKRRSAAYRANYENLPLRRASMPTAAGVQFYRRLRFGRLAEFSMLDSRQYRDVHLAQCVNDCEERWDPDRQYLGSEQEAWLFDGLVASTATWKVLGNQQISFDADSAAGPEESYSLGNWMGFAAARQRLYELIGGVDDVVLITGDAHKNAAANLHLDFNDLRSPIVATEFLGTSVTSGGNGRDLSDKGRIWRAESPHIKFTNSQRGYQRVRVTPQTWQVEYRTLPYVDRPGAPISTRAVATVEAGRPGIADLSQ